MAPPVSPLVHLSDADRARLKAILDEFDRSWTADRLPAKAGELPPDASLRRPALAEMVKIDLGRQWQSGRRVTVEEYLHAYPELGSADDPPLDLVEAEVSARRQFGADLNPEEFDRRF